MDSGLDSADQWIGEVGDVVSLECELIDGLADFDQAGAIGIPVLAHAGKDSLLGFGIDVRGDGFETLVGGFLWSEDDEAVCGC